MFEQFPNIKTKFPLNIACVDVETFDLEETAVVTELGMSLATFVLDEAQNIVVSKSETLLYSFNVLEQIARGRTLSKETFEFHLRTCGHDQTAGMVIPGLTVNAFKTSAILAEIQEKTNAVAEVWINGLSFDPSIMRSLARTYGYTTNLGMGSLWHHHKERDVRTVYRTFPLPGRENKKVAHKAAVDAEWNMEIARIYHQGVIDYTQRLVVPGSPGSAL